jgi:hypothetical protein
MNRVERAERKKAASKTGLVRDHRNPPARLAQLGEGFDTACDRHELSRRLNVVLGVLIDHPVAVTK